MPSKKKKGLGRQPLPSDLSTRRCAREECGKFLTKDDVAQGYRHCSEECHLQDPNEGHDDV